MAVGFAFGTLAITSSATASPPVCVVYGGCPDGGDGYCTVQVGPDYAICGGGYTQGTCLQPHLVCACFTPNESCASGRCDVAVGTSTDDLGFVCR